MSAEEFKRLRTSLGLTQNEIGHRLGVSSRTIRYYETGSHKIPLMVERLLQFITSLLLGVTPPQRHRHGRLPAPPMPYGDPTALL